MTSRGRVLFLTHSLGGGGSERVTVNVANYLERRGWTIELIPLVHSLSDYSVSSGIAVDFGLPQGGNRFLRGARKLIHIVTSIRRFDPDVVVSLGAGYGYLIAAALFHRHRLITSLRNDPVFLFRRHPARALSYRLAFAISSRIVFQTSGAMSYFRPRTRRKAAIIGNPLRDGLTHNSVPFEQRDREVVSFGRMLPQKRLDLLLEAFALFRARHPEYSLSIFGRGPERDNIARLVIERGLGDVVAIEDFRSDIHERIRNSSMYVLSSDVEGVSNSMLEAMAVGLPAACTDCPPGGARETIEAYETGMLAEVGDARSLAEAMFAIADSPDRANVMIARGSALLQEMSSEVVCERWELLIESVGTTGTDQ